ncbi:iron complex transport system permease protein [Actinocorallia herbida]|uniref:Iron complex transport system permease protein n=1 Tax=Actinocorallia herbida TaxID=58109 RepID=A0A3N1CY14_9ACTN|nr:iron chelate uptake ABC transporter family permease subunit [Actinocorallia herbida]ROO86172.1 iron complex transport system permease protein [Actinocorallia herbida]
MTSLVLRAGPVSARVERRTVVVSAVLVVIAAALGMLGLCYGAAWATPGEVLAALAGRGGSSVVIVEWRLPRVTAALVFGAALGVAGAVFQNLTRNSLGSPDIIGLDAGAYTGALLGTVLLSGGAATLAAGSIVGGLLAATAIYLLSWKSGVSGLRLIVIGIAMNAILTALNAWIVLRSELEIAMAMTGWSAGSLNGVDWADLAPGLPVLAVLFALMAVLAQAMHQSTLGDEFAASTGVRLNVLRPLVVVVGVGCTATVTAVAGPIVFVALAAPQIGRRLTGAAGVPFVPAALSGAVLLIAADLAAQMLLAPVSLPVGVMTTAVGGTYFIWLLFKETKKS